MIWILRFSYPLTVLLLWRRLMLWPWFGLYLVAVSASAWAYDAGALKWTLIADTPAMLLKAAATVEILWRIFEHEPRKHLRVVTWILLACCCIGVSITLGLEYRDSDSMAWITYKTIRTAMHGGLFFAMAAGFFYGRIYGAICPLYVWKHAAVWTAYLTLYASFAVVVPATTEEWTRQITLFRFGSVLCLAAWVWVLRSRTGSPSSLQDPA